MCPPTGTGQSIEERARTGSLVDPQDGMFDKQWENNDLEAALEERERIREQRADVNREYKRADEAAKGLLLGFELAVGEVARIGRFRIEKKRSAPRSVSFETEPSDRLTIKAEGGDD